jgi:glycosyltransferase involved in cell wall biosynthesis
MKVLFFTNTNVSIGAGIEKALINYVSNAFGNEVIVVQSQFYKVRRIDPGILNSLNLKVFTFIDFEHSISFLRIRKITQPLYQFLLPFVVRFSKFYNRKILKQIGGVDVVYLFKNEYWSLFKAKLVVGSNHGQFAFDNMFTKILSLLVKAGIIYRGIDAFHLFPKSAVIGERMKKKFFIVPIGISTRDFLPLPRNQAINVLFVGRLEYIKGIDIFIEVSRRFQDNSSVQFHVAGSGSFDEQLRQEANKNFHYHGVLDNTGLAELYGSCDLFLYPTRWDAFPTVIVEAASSGEYIITSDKIRGVYDDLLEMGYLEYVHASVSSIELSINALIMRIGQLRQNARSEHDFVAGKYDNSIVTRNIYSNFQELLKDS